MEHSTEAAVYVCSWRSTEGVCTEGTYHQSSVDVNDILAINLKLVSLLFTYSVLQHNCFCPWVLLYVNRKVKFLRQIPNTFTTDTIDLIKKIGELSVIFGTITPLSWLKLHIYCNNLFHKNFFRILWKSPWLNNINFRKLKQPTVSTRRTQSSEHAM